MPSPGGALPAGPSDFPPAYSLDNAPDSTGLKRRDQHDDDTVDDEIDADQPGRRPQPFLQVALERNQHAGADDGPPEGAGPPQHGHQRDEDGQIQAHRVLRLDVFDIDGVKGTDDTHEGGGDGVGLDLRPVNV